MPRRNAPPIDDDRGWLITPRALASVATVVGLIYTLYAPVRYVLAIGATVDALTARVAALEVERHRLGRGDAGPREAPCGRTTKENLFFRP